MTALERGSVAECLNTNAHEGSQKGQQMHHRELRVHHCSLGSGIRPAPEFAKKGLAQFAVNVGTKCGHGCAYCSTGAMLRCHPSFKAAGESPFEHGYAIIDPDMPDKVAADAKRIRNRGMVQLCTTVDAWAPEAQELRLGRRCLEAILTEPGWTVRILTKNAAVAGDFDLIAKHRDRVLIGLSLTGTPDKEKALLAVEPNASPIGSRMAALGQAHKMGLRTYGMMCPLLPGIADAPEQLAEMVEFCKTVGAEEVFAEAVNARGNGLILTEKALRDAGFVAEADSVGAMRKVKPWSVYVATLIKNTQSSMRRYRMIDGLKFLLYPKRLVASDRARIEDDGHGVVWL